MTDPQDVEIETITLDSRLRLAQKVLDMLVETGATVADQSDALAIALQLRERDASHRWRAELVK